VKAAVYRETGSPDVFRYEEVPDPSVGPGDILIDVEAISIEGGDTLNRLGGEMNQAPHVVGYQCESPMDVKGQFGIEGDAARHDMKGPLEMSRADSY
jgi:hypothetical protein